MAAVPGAPPRTYATRAGRLTTGQARALQELGPRFLIDTASARPLDLPAIFGNPHAVVLEIGFGSGASLIEMARSRPETNFLGIEVYPPGLGAALAAIARHDLLNVRLIRGDAVQVLTHCMARDSLDAVQIFFPDPWPKTRHHKRRLITDEFIALLRPLLRPGGCLYLATDWEHYAWQMLEVMQRAAGFANQSSTGTFVPRPQWRPLTKFERRGLRLEHGIWDLAFTREPPPASDTQGVHDHE